MKPMSEWLTSRAILLPISLLLVGCGQATGQEITPSPALTPDVTFLVSTSATPLRTPGAAPTATANVTPASDPLNGTRWALLFLRGKPLLESTRITLAFSGGFVSGSAGCNKYDRLVIGDDVARGKYKATEEGSLTIPALAITALACPTPDGVMDQEDAYLEALRGVVAYRLVENRLELQDAAGETILVFTR